MIAGVIWQLFTLTVPVALIVLGYLVGSSVEKRHLRSLEEREAQYRHISWTNLRTVPPGQRCAKAALVDGQAVIASEYFKNVAAKLRNFFGGELRSMETLMQRARREAILRMVEKAAGMGASAVWNVRLETSTIGRGGGGRGAAMAEVHAYGTALVLEEGP